MKVTSFSVHTADWLSPVAAVGNVEPAAAVEPASAAHTGATRRQAPRTGTSLETTEVDIAAPPRPYAGSASWTFCDPQRSCIRTPACVNGLPYQAIPGHLGTQYSATYNETILPSVSG